MKWSFGNSNSHVCSSSKPSLRQIAFDGFVLDVRKGVHEAVLGVALGESDRLRSRRYRDAAALSLGHDHPADLIDLFTAPLLAPESDRADAGAARHVDDL